MFSLSHNINIISRLLHRFPVNSWRISSWSSRTLFVLSHLFLSTAMGETSFKVTKSLRVCYASITWRRNKQNNPWTCGFWVMIAHQKLGSDKTQAPSPSLRLIIRLKYLKLDFWSSEITCGRVWVELWVVWFPEVIHDTRSYVILWHSVI